MIDVPIQVKDALREGRLRKNYRFQVLNDDGTVDFTIDNNNLVSETVNIDERMCSGDKIQYGLCEGSSLEFQYFGKDNITGRQLKVFLDVEYGEIAPYAIPMGYFDVKKCSRQASTGIIKAVCYNKLQSDYLDQKANDFIATVPSDNGTGEDVSLYTILQSTLNGYGIEEKHKDGIGLQVVGGSGFSQQQVAVPIQFDNEPSVTYYPMYRVTGNCKGYASISYTKVLSFGKLTDYLTLLNGILQSFHDYLFDPSHHVVDPDLVWLRLKARGFYYCGLEVSYAYGGDPIRYVPSNIYFEQYKYERIETLETAWEAEFVTAYIPSEVILTNGQGSEREFWKSNQTLRPSLFDDQIFVIDRTEFSAAESFRVDPQTLPDVTLRELQSAVFETECQFGKLDRETDLFSGVELNNSRLLPADTLYPDNALYPSGAQESAFRSQYSKLWADEGNVRKWRYLIITYKGLDENEQEKDFTLQRTVNADGTDDYNCSDNWLFRNLVWTAEDIGDYADVMVAKMQDITWFPFEMWCAGLPYLETGDEIEIPLGEDTYTSYILQRQLKGIQNLQDTYINGTLDIF